MPKELLSFPLEQIEEAMEAYSGFCVICGCEVETCEPDTRERTCPECKNASVYGAEELIVMGRVH